MFEFNRHGYSWMVIAIQNEMIVVLHLYLRCLFCRRDLKHEEKMSWSHFLGFNKKSQQTSLFIMHKSLCFYCTCFILCFTTDVSETYDKRLWFFYFGEWCFSDTLEHYLKFSCLIILLKSKTFCVRLFYF